MRKPHFISSQPISNWPALKMYSSNYIAEIYLSPANEVWDKVIYSQVCVIPSVHGGVCVTGGMHDRGHTYWGDMCGIGCAWQLGPCMAGGGGGGTCMTREMATEVGSTRPTGMHSCNQYV